MLDTNDDGSIQLSEIVRHYANVYNVLSRSDQEAKGFTWTPVDYETEIARRYDIDGNGKLTREEAKEWVFCFAPFFTNIQTDAPTVVDVTPTAASVTPMYVTPVNVTSTVSHQKCDITERGLRDQIAQLKTQIDAAATEKQDMINKNATLVKTVQNLTTLKVN